MDNLCHTLVGAAFGEAGLKRRTRFAYPALMIAANLPDVDVLVFASGTPSVAIRRGWTHGVLAQLLLPIAFAGVLLLIDRVGRGPNRLRHSRSGAALQRCDFGGLLLLSYIGVISHVCLDLLNNYGVRLLMPFSGRWFYGDALFIVDVWLWVVLGSGVFMARGREIGGPARIALMIAGVYIALMLWSARTARQIVLDAWTRDHGGAPRALMVGPVPVNPFRRTIIVDADDHYATGTFDWPRGVEFQQNIVPKNDRDPAVARAREDKRVRAVLVWARFPYYEIDRTEGATRVTLRDMRFGSRVGQVNVFLP